MAGAIPSRSIPTPKRMHFRRDVGIGFSELRCRQLSGTDALPFIWVADGPFTTVTSPLRCYTCGAPAIDARVDGDGSVRFVCAKHVEQTGPVNQLFDRAATAKKIALERMYLAMETREALRTTAEKTRALAQALRRAIGNSERAKRLTRRRFATDRWQGMFDAHVAQISSGKKTKGLSFQAQPLA
jgi:hypothetical protein